MNMGTTVSLLPYDLIRQDATDSETQRAVSASNRRMTGRTG
jgi:hypothetical protein